MNLKEPLYLFLGFFVLLFVAGCVKHSAVTSTPVHEPTLLPEQISTTGSENGVPMDISKEFALTSSAFEAGQIIPNKYSYKLGNQCNGENFSPPLEWIGTPQGTQSYVLTVIDPDGGDWVHWVLFNIPAETNNLLEVRNGPDIGVAGKNDFKTTGYGGPCPPSGTHHYIFTLYALDTLLDLNQGANLKDIQPLYKNHILAQAQLIGLQKAR